LEQISPGATEAPGETEALAPNALYADTTTPVISDDAVPYMDTVPVSDGAAFSTEKEHSYIETLRVVKARAMLGKKASENDVLVLAATM
jgi:hypothetical protein